MHSIKINLILEKRILNFPNNQTLYIDMNIKICSLLKYIG